MEEKEAMEEERKEEEDDKVALPLPEGPPNRKEKRKAIKKLKRKQMRKQIAAKERKEQEDEENPEEQQRAFLMAQQEAEQQRKLFQERESAWIAAMEEKKKKNQQEHQQKLLEASTHHQQREKENENENELNEDDEWEYVEEGPAEIIWQGNEIIFKKKKVRIPKKDFSQTNDKSEGADKPTSNPLPPQSEAFADHVNSSPVSAQHVLENVAQHVPNFGTEQDKAHCPFHLKTGACRFGQRCSRVHFYPDKSCTLLMKNMYTGPGLAWEQDEGLEHTDEEVECSYEEFYEDVHTEFLKFGEIVNFKVCKNGSFHLRGNVYVHYKSIDSAVLAYKSINGRYFAGKQIRCEFVNLTRWKVAICGEYMKSGFKTCSHGSACNFIHCFRNPGGDYEWADADKPPPKYWAKKMAVLFGYSDEHEKLMEQEASSVLKSSRKLPKEDSDGYHSRRSRSREIGEFNRRRKREDERKRSRTRDGEINDQNSNLKENYRGKHINSDSDTDREWLNKEEDKGKHQTRSRRSSNKRNRGDERSHKGYSDVDSDWAPGYSKKRHRHRKKHSFTNEDDERRSHEGYSDVDSDALPRDREKWHNREGRSSRKRKRQRNNDEGDIETEPLDRDRDRGRDERWHRKSGRSRYKSKDYGYASSDTESGPCSFDRDGDSETECCSSRKRSKQRKSGLQDDYEDYENKNEEKKSRSMEEKDRQEHRHERRKSSKRKKLESNDDRDVEYVP